MHEHPAKPVHIARLDDPRVADYRDVRDADLVGRKGLFMAEGELVVRTLLESPRYRPKSLFLSEKRLPAMGDALRAVREDAPVYVAPQEVMDDIVGFHIHRGVLAAGVRGEDPAPERLAADIPPGPALALCLETLANHDNVGGVFRAAAAFGARAVLLDQQSCDPLYRKAIRVSMGHALRIPFARAGATTDHIAILQRAGFTVCALALRDDAQPLDEYARAPSRPERIAILLGAEGPGLTDEAIDAADTVLKIPMAEGVDSLNVAQAAAIACHALQPPREGRGEG